MIYEVSKCCYKVNISGKILALSENSGIIAGAIAEANSCILKEDAFETENYKVGNNEDFASRF